MFWGFPGEFLPGYVPCNVIPSHCRRPSKHSCVCVASQEHTEIAICLGSCPKDLVSGQGVVLERAGESEGLKLEVEKFQGKPSDGGKGTTATSYHANNKQPHECLPIPATF